VRGATAHPPSRGASVFAMGEPAHHRFTFDEYLMLEEDSGVKHEFAEGQVWAMSGGTPEHAAVAGNLLTLLNVQLSGKKCRVFTSDLRVRVTATGLGTYPDVSVVCGRLELDPEDAKRHTIVNPRVLVEVLSPSTEGYDRGEKLRHYQQLLSVEEIVLVAHDRPEVEVVRREADGTWSRHVARAGEVAKLASVDCDLPVAEVFRDPLAGV
jgi:Uma2 family endonuclease